MVEYEVVLANGDIVKASKTKNVDLFNVLKGGGNAFGIVTSFKLKAYPIGPVCTLTAFYSYNEFRINGTIDLGWTIDLCITSSN